MSKPAWLLIFEFQSQHDEDKPKVLLLEASVFLCYARDTDREGGPFQPLPVFVYLKGKCPSSAVTVRTPSGHGFGCDPPVWEIAEDSAEQMLAVWLRPAVWAPRAVWLRPATRSSAEVALAKVRLESDYQ